MSLIFLCGGYSDVQSIKPVSIRDAICRQLAKSDVFERIRIAEDYKDWAHDSIYRDLVSFEQHLAELSSVIVLILESPGAIAELGLFSAIDEFRRKLLVFIDTEHYKQDSFIRLGPVDFLEKIHNNPVECHTWLRREGRNELLDQDAAMQLQPDLAEAIAARIQEPAPEEAFRSNCWLHVTLLVCDLLNLFSALTIREITKFLEKVGIEHSETEARQRLFVLEKMKIIVMEPKGDQRFYICVDQRQFLRLRFDGAKYDLDRVRSDIMPITGGTIRSVSSPYKRSGKAKLMVDSDSVRSRHTDLIRRMSVDLGLLSSQLESIIRTAPLRYKKFTIPKRDGSARQVAQPAREVKDIQRWIVRELRPYLPIHDAVAAYEKGCSIVRNANVHRVSRFILKMDFRDFFPSITIDDVMHHLARHCDGRYSIQEIKQLAFGCVWTPNRKPPLRLCIGAPSSPFLSNSILYEFDEAVSQHAHANGVRYTRYADDITFSTNRDDILLGYPSYVRSLLEKIGLPGLRLNTAKTVHASRAGKRVVTGLVLTPSGSLSVGRERKRLVRSMFHRYVRGLLTPEEQETLRGLLAFIDGVEPGFSDRLRSRYP